MNYEEIINTIFTKYFVKLYRFFYSRTINKEISEDLASDTFIAFSEKVRNNLKQKNDISLNDYEKYLFGIAKHKFTDYLRNKYRENTLSLDQVGEIENQLINFNPAGNYLTEYAFQFIEQLPSKQREILQLRLIHKKTLNEICEQLGRNMEYVRTTQKRGIKKLKELLEKCPQTTT